MTNHRRKFLIGSAAAAAGLWASSGATAQPEPAASTAESGARQSNPIAVDYERIAGILHKHNYRGDVSLEYEGRDDARTAIPQSPTLLRKAFSA